MTTHRGTDANTSLIDAIDLSKCLTSQNWEQYLSKYEAKMYKRGFKMVKESLEATKNIHGKNSENFKNRLSMKAITTLWK